jgi:S1-C subfamily serine protease
MGCFRVSGFSNRPCVRPAAFAAIAGSLTLSLAGALTARAGEESSSPESSRLALVTHDDETIHLANLEKQFRAVGERVAPSVVAISAAINAVDSDDALRSDELNPRKLDAMLDRVTRTVGTGFVIDADGFILTNEHVVADASGLWVTTDDHKVYPAIVVGSDPRADLAVLKIPAQNLLPARFAEPGAVRRGEWAIAIGNPYGLAVLGEMAMSVGVISATDRSLPKLASRENRLYANLIQTTAHINPGNSGGPLFDVRGAVIGINTAVVLPQKQTNGIGFAMPVTDELLAKVRQLRQGREVVYGYFGVTVSTATTRQRREAGGPSDELGVMIDAIEKGSPAADASLRAGDLLLSVDDLSIRDSDQFVRVVGSTPVDRAAAVRVARDGKVLTLQVTPRRRALPSVAVTRDGQRFRWRGLVLGPVPENWTKPDGTHKPSGGIMVFGVDSESPLAKDGIASGTVITAVAGKPVADLIALQQIINDTPAEQCKLTLSDAAANIASAE